MKEDLVTLDQERQWAKFDGLLTKFMMKFPYMQVCGTAVTCKEFKY